MKIIIKENNWLTRGIIDFGWGNGYVLLPNGHKYHNVHYDNIPVSVHGGLTFSQLVDEKMLEYWPELSNEDLGMWAIGFDTCHYQDDLESWPKEAVQHEAEQLAQQLVNTQASDPV